MDAIDNLLRPLGEWIFWLPVVAVAVLGVIAAVIEWRKKRRG